MHRAGGQSSHVHSCVCSVMRGANGVRDRVRGLRAQLPILNHYEEGKEKEGMHVCSMMCVTSYAHAKLRLVSQVAAVSERLLTE